MERHPARAVAGVRVQFLVGRLFIEGKNPTEERREILKVEKFSTDTSCFQNTIIKFEEETK